MIHLFNKTKINIFILVIWTFTTLFLLAGCGNDAPSSTSEGTSANESNSQSEKFYISGLVFLDTNSNGTFDSDENGLQGVTIKGQNAQAQTNSSGEFKLESQSGSDTLMVDTSTLPAGLVLTTSNDSQTFSMNSNITAEPIGYIDSQSNAPMYSFEDYLTNDSEYDNYYFELVMMNSGQPANTMKLWVIGNSMKAEAQGMITYYNEENGTMGVYTAQTNQVVITPIMESTPILTPFTFIDEFDPQTFEDVMFKSEETLDGKDVLVFENMVPGFEAKYYVWKEHNMIIKMETSSAGFESSFYFKDLSLGTVTQDDINYPAGAEVLNLSGQ